MGVHHREGGLPGKAAELGKLPVEYPEHHGQGGVDKGGAGKVLFHKR